VARFISRTACVFMVSTLGLGSLIGWPRSVSVAGLCAVFALYDGWLQYSGRARPQLGVGPFVLLRREGRRLRVLAAVSATLVNHATSGQRL
jgi:hypothetical protein